MPLTITNIFVPNTLIRSSHVNTNFTDVKSWADAHEVLSTGIHGVGSGEIVGTTLTQVLSNKTLVTPNIRDTSGNYYYTITPSELTKNVNITLPALTEDDTFVFSNKTATLTNKTLTSPVINGGTVNNVTITSPDINGGTWYGTIDGNWTAAGQTCANLGTVTTVVINGGSIDNTTIGNTTPASGKFTSLVTTSDATINSITVGRGCGGIDTNTAVGCMALYKCTTGFRNTACGYGALYDNTTGYHNTACGYGALVNNTTGCYNTACGYCALFNSTTGCYNTAVGYMALFNNTTGGNNTCIGRDAGSYMSPFYITTESNRVVIGNNNITNAYIAVSWTVTSDERDKADIQTSPYGLDYIMRLRPITFRWDRRSWYWETVKETVEEVDENGNKITREVEKVIKNPRTGEKKENKISIGFSAQEVAALEKELGIPNDLVADTEQPEMYTVKETALIPILVKAIQEQQKRIEELEKRLGI